MPHRGGSSCQSGWTRLTAEASRWRPHLETQSDGRCHSARLVVRQTGAYRHRHGQGCRPEQSGTRADTSFENAPSWCRHQTVVSDVKGDNCVCIEPVGMGDPQADLIDRVEHEVRACVAGVGGVNQERAGDAERQAGGDVFRKMQMLGEAVRAGRSGLQAVPDAKVRGGGHRRRYRAPA